MKWSGGLLAAALGALAVLAGGLWGQTRALERTSPPRPQVFVAATLFRPEPFDDSLAPASASLVVVTWPENLTRTLVHTPGTFPAAPTWSPDGSTLAWVEFLEEDGTARAVFWERKTGRRRYAQLDVLAFNGFAWSPDSRLVASPGERFLLWNVDGELILDGEEPVSNGRTNGTLAGTMWNPSGTRMAYRLNDTLYVYDRRSNQVRHLTAEQLGMPGSLEEVFVTRWKDEVTLAADGIDSAWRIDVTVGRASAIDPGEDALFGLGIGEAMLQSRLKEEHSSAAVAVRRSADGRRIYGAWAEGNSGEGAVVFHHAEEITIPMSNLDTTVRNLDVVLVGPWP